MTIVGGNASTVVSQVQQDSAARSTQSDFSKIVGEVAQWNPDAPIPMVQKWVQNAYRRILDERLWYGMMVKGVLAVPDMYSVGTVDCTFGSATVQGNGTAFTADFIGRQFRLGFNTPITTIKNVNDGDQTLELELPWASPTRTGSGYQIFQSIVNFGWNVKRVVSCLNQNWGYRLIVDMPRNVLDANDVWRTTVGQTRYLVSHPPSSDGKPQWELYPIATTQQPFPFVVYVQPPDLTEDDPNPLPWIRSDVIVLGAIPDALLFRGKSNKYYDPQTANWKKNEFMAELLKLKMADDNHSMKDLIWDYERYPLARGAGSNQETDSD